MWHPWPLGGPSPARPDTFSSRRARRGGGGASESAKLYCKKNINSTAKHNRSQHRECRPLSRPEGTSAVALKSINFIDSFFRGRTFQRWVAMDGICSVHSSALASGRREVEGRARNFIACLVARCMECCVCSNTL